MNTKKINHNHLILDSDYAHKIGLLKNQTKSIFINGKKVNVYWPKTSQLNSILNSNTLKNDLHSKVDSNPNAKRYYKQSTNKEINFRRVIDLEILSSRISTNTKLNNLKIHDVDHNSSYILTSEKMISTLKKRRIKNEFNDFFDVDKKLDNNENLISDFEVNKIRKMACDYKILGNNFLKMFASAPSSEIPSLFNSVKHKLIINNKPMIEVFYTHSKIK